MAAAEISPSAGGDRTPVAGAGAPADLTDLIEQARRALAARLSGRPVADSLPGDGPEQAGVQSGQDLTVVLGIDEATRRPVIRVCQARTRRPVREVSPAALLRPPGHL